MKPEKMKSLSEAKLRYCFPKIVKFHFCPFFGLCYDFINNFIVRFIHEEDVTPSLFSLCYKKALSIRIKKNQILKTLTMWVFVPLKCQQTFKILQLVWILTPNKF